MIWQSFHIIRECCYVGMDISTCLKLSQMHRCFFEAGRPRVCNETSPGLTCASRNRRRVISYAVFHLFILSVVFPLLWGCIVTNQLENFQAISVSQIGKPCLPVAREEEDRAQWQHIRVPASGQEEPWPPPCPHQGWLIQPAGLSPATTQGGRAGGCLGWCWVEY